MAEPDQSLPAAQHLAATPPSRPPGGWTHLLERTIHTEILPALLSASAGAPACAQREIEAFVAVILAGDQAAARTTAQRVLAGAGGRKALLTGLLTPAARHLGLLWEQDLCDFMDVTLGAHQLDMLMRESEFSDGQEAVLHRHHYHALLLPAPGEQHRFGIAMVADVFRGGGWRVSSGPALPRSRLLRRVRDDWFDAVGLSISCERGLGGIAACLRAVRQASRNPGVMILLGGHAIIGHEERSRFLGADILAVDAYQALRDANTAMMSAPRRECPQALRQFILV